MGYLTFCEIFVLALLLILESIESIKRMKARCLREIAHFTQVQCQRIENEQNEEIFIN